MQPGDRLVCAFVDRLEAGNQFQPWPLHVTIVPWFRADITSEELANELKSALAGIRSFEARLGREATMGNDRTVNLVQSPEQFEDIEISVRSTLKRQEAWLVDETTKHKHAYQPHVTAQKSSRVHEGDSFWCDRLYIVGQKGDHKIIESEIALE